MDLEHGGGFGATEREEFGEQCLNVCHCSEHVIFFLVPFSKCLVWAMNDVSPWNLLNTPPHYWTHSLPMYLAITMVLAPFHPNRGLSAPYSCIYTSMYAKAKYSGPWIRPMRQISWCHHSFQPCTLPAIFLLIF